MIRVIVVDDHEIVRRGLSMFLALDPDIEVVGEASGGEAAIQLVREVHPDIALMDILMPGMDGVTATAMIRRDFPATNVIALTSSLDSRSVIGVIKAGALGFLPKTTEADELCRSVHAVASGKVQLGPDAAALLVDQMRSPIALSDRELAILKLLVLGKTNKEIAEALEIGEKTVKTHMSSIMPKLNVQSRTQAALAAVKLGLVPGD
jgi:NarL family two-component system response regulator LiaR